MPTSPRSDPPDRPPVPRSRRLLQVADRASFPLLRASLGVVFIWFGALKLSDSTPVADLVASTLPFAPRSIVVPALGLFEVLLGVALLVGRWLGPLILVMMAHLGGTFLVLVTQPDVAFQKGNPLLLTMTGEFVVKNIVLITAGLVLATWSRSRQTAREGESLLTVAAVPAPVLADTGLADAAAVD